MTFVRATIFVILIVIGTLSFVVVIYPKADVGVKVFMFIYGSAAYVAAALWLRYKTFQA